MLSGAEGRSGPYTRDQEGKLHIFASNALARLIWDLRRDGGSSGVERGRLV